MVSLLIHVEQYNVIGILPSQLESLALVARAAGIGRTAFIDSTTDGVMRAWGFTRYGSLAAWLRAERPKHISVFTPGGIDVRSARRFDDDWLAFGPAMGFNLPDFLGWEHQLVGIPGGVLNSRDAVPIALWEVMTWPGQ